MKFTIIFSLALNILLLFLLGAIYEEEQERSENFAATVQQLQNQSKVLGEQNQILVELNRTCEDRVRLYSEYTNDLFALLEKENERKPAIEPNHFLVFYDHSRGSGHVTFQTNHGWVSSDQIYEHLYETAPCISNAILTGIVPLSEAAFLAWKPKESKEPCDPLETLPRLDWLRWDADTLIVEIDSTKTN